MAREVKIMGSLRKATKEDLFTEQELPRVNKMIFIHSFDNKGVITPYIISDQDELSVKGIYRLWHFRNPSVLTSNHSEGNFLFNLILRPGEWNDFFLENVMRAKGNVVFYIRDLNGKYTGPHEMYSNLTGNELIRLQEAFNSERLFVPSENQTFEPIIIKKAS